MAKLEIVEKNGLKGIRIVFEDHGPGIPKGQEERVFERFIQNGSESATRTNRGLGLAFCKIAIEAHGGRVWIEDASPGAVFCAWISDAG